MTSLGKFALILLIAAGGNAARAQERPPDPPHLHPGAMPMHHGLGQSAGVPSEGGQAAFGAIQEIVEVLLSDPHTDWSKVDIDVLRQHLIDMDEVTMRANVRKEPIDGGLRIEVTGSDRTLAAIQRMVPEHAHEIDGRDGWAVRTAALPNGVVLTVTAADPSATQRRVLLLKGT